MIRWPQAILGCEHEWDDSDIIVFGAPMDTTTSYRPGTRMGPAAIRMESNGMETYSPYQGRDLEELRIHDAGELELAPGNAGKSLQLIQDMTDSILKAGKKPLMLGGEHLVTLGAVESVLKHYLEVHIIHFDAHADLREDYMKEKLSHACVMRRIWELLGDGRIHQFGIRSGTRDEFTFAREHCDFHPFSAGGIETTVQQLQGKPVYLTIDLDVLDPSIFPGTGTPEPGGLTFKEFTHALAHLQGLDIVGADLVEYAPPLDPNGISAATACTAMRETLLLMGND